MPGSGPEPTAGDAGSGRSTAPRISPAARRRAVRLGIAVEDISGSGPSGRIVLADLEGLSGGEGHRALTSRKRPDAAAILARPARPPLAQVNITAACHLDALIEKRNALKASSGDKVPSFSTLFVKALGLALREVPGANVVLENDRIVRRGPCHVAYIVADRYGRVAFPVVENADTQSLKVIAASLGGGVEAHRKWLEASLAEPNTPEPPAGAVATTAIANIGPGRISRFDTAVARPHASVLAIASPERVIVPAEAGETIAADDPAAFRVVTRINCTFGVDSRLISGLIAADLLHTFQRIIETPDLLLG